MGNQETIIVAIIALLFLNVVGYFVKKSFLANKETILNRIAYNLSSALLYLMIWISGTTIVILKYKIDDTKDVIISLLMTIIILIISKTTTDIIVCKQQKKASSD